MKTAEITDSLDADTTRFIQQMETAMHETALFQAEDFDPESLCLWVLEVRGEVQRALGVVVRAVDSQQARQLASIYWKNNNGKDPANWEDPNITTVRRLIDMGEPGVVVSSYSPDTPEVTTDGITGATTTGEG